MVYFTMCESQLHLLRDAVRDAEDLTARDRRSAGPPVYLYVTGADGETFWCPDCRDMHAVIQGTLVHKSRVESAIVVEIQVSSDSYRSEQCPVKRHAQIAPHVQQKGVPCVVSWNSVTSFLDNNIGDTVPICPKSSQ
jgi:hypothetical protein